MSDIINRADQLRRDNEQITNRLPLNRLIDIDSAVITYLQKIVQNITKEDNTALSVPIVYASPEVWKSVQHDGYLRNTKTNKLLVPIMAIRRSTVSRDRNKIKNIDGNNSKVYQFFQQSYNQLNKYDRFSTTNNIIPRKEFYTVVIPDYVTITYNCKIWTDFITHMNQIIESINYMDSAYWGTTDKYKFYTNVSDFGEIEEITSDDGRSVRCDFNLTVHAFIIPQAIQKELNSSKKSVSVGSLGITFKEE